MGNMLVISLIFMVPAWIGALSFTQQPALTSIGAGQWQVEFTVDESTDVEVAIVDMSDSTIVRHLAAGVLGSNPPAPLASNVLHQTLTWDGKDDLGNTLSSGSYGVRVRAGMSVALDRFAGGDPYCFHTFFSLVGNPDGYVYAFGTAAECGPTVIRRFNTQGGYERTIFPTPAELSPARAGGLGVVPWADGSFSPATGGRKAYLIRMSNQLVGGDESDLIRRFADFSDSGKLTIFNGGFTLMNLSTDGSCEASGNVQFPLTTSPQQPYWRDIGGRKFLCLSPDKQSVYLSSFYLASGVTGVTSTDTGFWKDGQVFKVNKTTGVVTPFIALDSVPTSFEARKANIGPVGPDASGKAYGAIHGMATDDSGRLYLCDRHHSRISVYDTSGAYLGGVPVKYPEVVQVTPVTGEIYVATRICTGYYIGFIRLYKFAGFRGSPAPVCSLTLVDDTRFGGVNQDAWVDGGPVSLVLARADGQTNVWMGYSSFGIRIYRDNGASFTLLNDMGARTGRINLAYNRMVVDRKTETAYINNGICNLEKITDWSNPVMVPCSTQSGGVKSRLYAGDMTISFDNQLYLREGTGYTGPITRYTLDPYPAPVAFANTGANQLSPSVYGRMATGNYGDRGLAVAPDKRVTTMYMCGWNEYFVGTLGDSGQRVVSPATGEVDTVIKPLTPYCGGVKYDLQGNLYVGAASRSVNHVIPDGFETDIGYMSSTGAVFKYPPGGKGKIESVTGSMGNGFSYGQNAEADATGFSRIYKSGLSPFSGLGDCVCRTPRFDVDLYGRLFIPCAATQKVAVVDNNDNPILTFGKYGNWDSQGPEIPLCYSQTVCATENYLYVTDYGNTRVVRVKMNYALENMHLPEAAASVAAGTRPAVTLAAAPNPFNPAVTITLTGGLARGASVKVFDLTGKLIADLTGRVSAGRVAWNASGHASGVYVVSAERQGLSLRTKIIYSK